MTNLFSSQLVGLSSQPVLFRFNVTQPGPRCVDFPISDSTHVQIGFMNFKVLCLR